MDVRFLLLDVQKEERSYQLRPQTMWSFFLFKGIFVMDFSESLKKNKDFTTVYRRGVSKANRQLVMYIYHNNTDRNRIGISVSKKVGNSVVRHHLTRLIRESYRLNEEMFNSGLDIVVVAREASASANFDEIQKSLLHNCKILK